VLETTRCRKPRTGKTRGWEGRENEAVADSEQGLLAEEASSGCPAGWHGKKFRRCKQRQKETRLRCLSFARGRSCLSECHREKKEGEKRGCLGSWVRKHELILRIRGKLEGSGGSV